MRLERPSEKEPGQQGEDRLGAGLETAIKAAQDCLLRQFCRTDVSHRSSPSRRLETPLSGGYWLGELEADSTLESDYILFLYFLDPEAHREKIAKLARYIVKLQLEDGSWNIYHGGPGDVSASVKAYFALKLAGYSPDDPIMVRAREAILRLGGAESVNSFTKIYLSFLNQFDWKEVPAIPPEIVLLPRFFYFNIYEISYWSRAILIPLSIIYAKRPKRQVSGELSIREIFSNGNANGNGHGGVYDEKDSQGEAAPAAGLLDAAVNGSGNGNGNGAESRLNGTARKPNGWASVLGVPGRFPLKIPRDPNLFSWKSFFMLMDRILKLVEMTPVKPLRNLALKKAEEWMVSRIEHSDGLGAIFPAMVNSVLAMRSLGYDEDHPYVASTLHKLRELEIEEDGMLRLQPCLSPVWDTALALNALGESGVASDSPEMLDAGRWLVSKEVRKPGDWQVRLPDVEVGGWYFQFQNEFYPDVDDTAAVLMALERVDPSQIEGIESAIARGINWVLSMQCSDGGWAAFDVDVHREALTHVPYADHNAMLDPACADITGRVLEMLGRFPSLRHHPQMERAIRRGIEYLKKTQEKDGAWYGRWGVNYIYGTWQALKGLMAVGEEPRQEYIRRAAEFLKEHQNADGGWGESCNSYKEPQTRGTGTSTASQTAWAVMGLIAAGEVNAPEVERGIQYLISHQAPDGNWKEDEWTGTGFPCVFYLKYHLYRLYFPLFALGQYRNGKLGISSIRERHDIELQRRVPPQATAKKSSLRALIELVW